ncbi:MAG: FHA domain-containing protein [Chloroflexota bacterium]
MTGIVVLILRILMTVALFAFLFWAFVAIWRDLRFQIQSLSSELIPAILFTSMDTLTENDFRFQKTEILLGRDPNSAFPVLHDTVSARHARFTFFQNQWWVEDLNSTNGTFLNDERLTTKTVIVNGDEIRCGQVSYRINIEAKKII